MAKFRFVALDAQGKETEGILDAESQARAVALIKEKNFFPTSVVQVGQVEGKQAGGRQQKGGGLQTEIKLPKFLGDFFAGKVKAKQLMVFTRQLSTLLEAGVPLLRGLQILVRQEKHPSLRKGLAGIGESVESGSTLTEALAQQSKIFSPFYVNMVRAGEAGGVLDTVLSRLAEFMEKNERLKNKIRGAMVYPIVVLVIAMVILAVMIVFIVPKFTAVFSSLIQGGKLPWLTQKVIDFSTFAWRRGIYVIIGMVVLGFLFKMAARTTRGRHFLDFVKLKIPVFGKLLRLTAVAHFSRTLSTLLTSGVGILQALNIVAETVGNSVVARAIHRIHDSVKEGENMAPTMEESGAFPLMAVSMVEVGEETGALPEMLSKVADAYEDEVDTAVEALTSILEPLLIVLLALIVGTIVIAMFLPIVRIMKTLK